MIRIVYSDLDGTMVGPRGCFFRAESGATTLEPARALVELLDAGVLLVLVSGRTEPQLVEACRVFGADGFVGELGAVLGWDGGRSVRRLRGAAPAYDGTMRAQIVATGVVDALFARHPGRLEWHAPWHLGHAGDAMLRGHVDVETVDVWLAEQGLGWLRLVDNGVLPARAEGRVDSTLAVAPVRVYHLMPAGLSKGLGVAADLTRRGLTGRHAVAVGDSVSDLTMAGVVGRMWLTANGARAADVRAAAAAYNNVVVTDGPVGAGWVQAVRAALRG